jgi:hypothetical protein
MPLLQALTSVKCSGMSWSSCAKTRGPQVLVDELREIAGMKFDGVPRPRQIPMRENERGFVAVRPAEAAA